MSLKFIIKQGVYKIKHIGNLFITRGRRYPHIFSVEVVLGCNLKCPDCALGGGRIRRKTGYMSFENFKIIADKIKPYVTYLYLHIWGEPLLNPDIYKIIEYSSKFCRTNISTNGMLVTEEVAERLILSGVSDIIISVDGVTQEVYEQYRRGGDVEQALNSIRWLVEANKRHGNVVKILPQFIVFRHNQSEMDDFRKFCYNIGVKPMFRSPYFCEGSNLEESTLQDYIRPHFSNSADYKNAICDCDDSIDAIAIDLEGNVVLCVYDANSEVVFGNIFNDSIHEIYYGKKHQEFIKELREDRNCPDLCVSNCLKYRLEK